LIKKGKKKSNIPIISGTINPAKWDDFGKVIGVAIKTDNQQTYIVEHTKAGEELLNHINQKVEAKGRIRERIDGSTLISVRSYMTFEDRMAADRLSSIEANE
jgi:hypothetical protein